MTSTPHRLSDLSTPCLLVDQAPLLHNLETMSLALPGPRCRPHVKAHKCTALAAKQVAAGHAGLTCATAREALGLAAAGLGTDILLANEVVDADRLRALAGADARITIAVDSDETARRAARAGLKEVVIDVDVGLHRCGCRPSDAGRLAAQATSLGLTVRGVMGYEGHAVGVPDREERERLTRQAMEFLIEAHAAVGGELITAGGTGTYDCNTWANEIQAGSYLLMDTAYGKLNLPFEQALLVLATVTSVSDGWAVADCGLKALGMDHGLPTLLSGTVRGVHDEHILFEADELPSVGDRVYVVPAHVDPTVAYHEAFWVTDGEEVVDRFQVDLRGW
jgi:D-serine deaminase-like pyridoxal phosphate-dependent protein